MSPAPQPDSTPHLPVSVFLALGLAAFSSSAGLRMCDPMLPTIADEFATTPGQAAMIITTYAACYGLLQLVYGPLGDRYGRFRLITAGTLCCGIATMAGALSPSLTLLAVARGASGLFAAAIIPNALAFLGDMVAPQRRQATLARFMVAMSTGAFMGQVIGGFIAEHIGWRWVFVVSGGAFMVAAAAMLHQMLRHRDIVLRANGEASLLRSFAAIGDLPRLPLARLILPAVLLEAMFYFGPYAMLGSDLHIRFGLPLDAVGFYAALTSVITVLYGLFAPSLIGRIGEINLISIAGVAFSAGFLLLANLSSTTWLPLAVLLMGTGFVLFHNCIQANATQMHPTHRGTGVAVFASMFFIGQMIGVTLSGLVFDSYGAQVLYLISAVALPLMVFAFRFGLKRLLPPDQI